MIPFNAREGEDVALVKERREWKPKRKEREGRVEGPRVRRAFSKGDRREGKNLHLVDWEDSCDE